MKVHPNGYYNYKKQRKNAIKKKKASILKEIEKIYHERNGVPGYRMMKSLLESKGIYLSAQTVRKYMNTELNLKSVTRKRKHESRKCGNPHKVFKNLLQGNFTASARYQKWCVDFTYMKLSKSNKRYNCTIIDLYSREVVASVNGKNINSQLAIDTLKEALKKAGGVTGVLLHSDQGSQFTSKSFVDFCEECEVIQSMSKAGCPGDNAPMERYFNTLKAELLNLRKFKDERKLYMEVNAFAYGWYNNVRPHSYNNFLPPAKVA